MKRTKKLINRLIAICAVMLLSMDALAQTTISGHIQDENGEDLIGAYVVVKGTQTGGVTDMEGRFSLQCQPGATLVVSYVGFNPLLS